jgi:acetolactate synthase-1/2/3 large subunit
LSEGTASDVLVECLRTEGVDRVFGIPGEETLDLVRSLQRSDIEFVQVRHEQAAALMAGMVGRLTGRPGVCLSTLGPGATNLVTGVADAHLDHAPLVVLTSQAGTERMHKQSHQYVDLLALMKPITKWNARVANPEVLPEALAQAFRIAAAEKPGPTHLELPEDVMAAPRAGRPLRPSPSPPPEASDATIAAAADAIGSAAKAVILAGNGVIRARASVALRELAVGTGIGVAETFMAKGAMASDDPLWLGTVGMQAADYELAGFADADVVVCVGYDLVEHAPSHWNPDADKRIVCLDSVQAEVDAHFQCAVEVIGELGSSLTRLRETLADEPTSDDVAADPPPLPRGRAARASSRLSDLVVAHLAHGLEDIAFPLRPGRALAELRRLPQDAIVVSDVGLHKLWLARLYPTRHPQTVFVPNGLAGMGVALPMGIAAKLVHPERAVVCVSGDGGFLMNCAELETAARLGTPVINVVWEDRALSAIVTKQESRFGESHATRFGGIDFVSLAEAFGLPAWRCESAADFGRHLEHALSLDRPSLIAVPVDYALHPEITGEPAKEALTA